MTSKPSSSEASRFLRTDHLKANLKQRSVRGGLITLSAQPIRIGLSFLVNVVLARMLTPQDYGLVGMVTAITGLISLFKDLGLTAATIQREEINHQQVSTLFWVNVFLGCATALVTVVLAPVIANFYNEPRLIPITLTLAVGFLFSGLGAQHAALLNRQMEFTQLVLNDILSQIIGIGVAITAAWYGLGYWALVIFPLLSAAVSTIGYWIACDWRPGLPARKVGVRSLLSFGANLTGFGIVNYFARNLDNILIGRFWGAQELGLYTKAYQLLLLPLNQINSPIASVAIPVLSRLADSPMRYRQVYLRVLEKIVLITMPLVVFMLATSDWLVELLLGKQWSGASNIFMLLGVAGVLQPIANTTGWLFISQGRTRHMFQWGIIGSSILVVSFLVGLPWGAIGVASAYSILFTLVLLPILFWFTGRTGPVRTGDFYKTTAPIALASMCPALVLIGFRAYFTIENPIIGCTISLTITTLSFLIALSTFKIGRTAIRDMKEIILLLKAQKNSN